MGRHFIRACALLIAVIGFGRIAIEVHAGGETPSLLYTAAQRYEPLAWMRGGERFPAGASILLKDGNGARPLLPAFAATADPSVSFDETRVLFAGKAKAGDPWQVWEAPLAGGEPHRITLASDDCVRPFYLPEDRIVYARKADGRFVIETVSLSGGKPLALTYGPANFLPSDVLRDGRILFEAGQPLGNDGTPDTYTVYSDGSGVESYRCDHSGPHSAGKQVASGDIVYASQSGLARFTSARATEIRISTPAGEYAGDVVETSGGDWLLPWRPNAKAQFQLMQWTPGMSALRPLVSDPNANVVQPTLVVERHVPNRHPTGLHDWNNANLLCLNAYTSKYSFAPGSIHSVRMYARENSGATKLLGTAPVERDGSFFVQVPSDTAIQIELVDTAGKTLKRESGFFWMRRGEQRGCVGCHAGPETAPENAVPMILLKSTTPADMTGAANVAAGGQ